MKFIDKEKIILNLKGTVIYWKQGVKQHIGSRK